MAQAPTSGAPLKTLERRLDLTAVIALSMSAMLGSGIFVLPGLAAAKTGPSVWLAYIAAGLCVLPTGLSKSELTTAMPTSGGTYIYLERAFGPLVGTVAGLGSWLSLLLKASFALVGLGAYLLVLADLPIKMTAVVLLAVIVVLNIRGVKRVSQVQVIVIAVSLVALACLATVAGFTAFDASRLEEPFRHGSGGFLAAVAFVFVSYAGVTKVAAIAEEVKEPQRNLPLGILLSLLAVTAIYGGIAFILVGTIPLGDFQDDVHPLYTLAQYATDSHVIGIAIAVVGVATMASMANAGLLAASRFPFAMSRDQLLPPFLSELHPRHLTPTACIAFSGAVMAVAILLFDIERIAKLASAFMILLYVAENATVVVLRETRVQWYQPKYRSPLYPWMQLFGVLNGVVLLAAMGPAALAATVGILAAGGILFFGYGRRRTARLGVVAQRRRRRALIQADQPLKRRVEHIELTGEAAVVVALFGNERSPEMLVELGQGLAEGGSVKVVHLTEVPEQTVLDAVAEDPLVASVRRRVLAMAESQQIPLEFEALVTRDLVHSVHELVTELRCSWLAVEWGGRTRGAFSINDRLGWLGHNLPCNVATFSDAGVRYIRRILVDVHPGPHDALVLGTADHLAKVHGAHVTFSRFVPPDAPRDKEQSEADYLDQVRELCSASSDTLLLRGNSDVGALAQASAAYDLLISSGREERTFVGRILRTSREDRLTEGSICSVLRLQAPRASTHVTFERYRPRSRAQAVKLASALNPRCIEVKLSITKKDALFRHVAGSCSRAVPELGEQQVLDALWEREGTQNTSLGMGLALPHATLSEAGRTHVGVFTTAQAVDYAAPDGEGVDVFFVTLGTPGDRQAHLVLLSSLSKLVLKTPLLERVRAADDPDDVIDAVEECTALIDV